MKTASSVFLALVVLASAETAFCQESAHPAENQSWYGYQILLADGLSYATLIGGLAARSPVAYAGVGGYVAAAPIIHGFNHQSGKLIRSVLLRLLVPVGAFWVAHGMTGRTPGEENDIDDIVNGFWAAGIGMVAVTAVDAALAWKSPPVAQPVAPPAPPPLVSLSSVGVVPTPNGASFVVGGQF